MNRSNGYEAVAEDFITRRTGSSAGVATVREWAKNLPTGAAVLDLGCGHGVPISEALLGQGVNLYAVDASPILVAAFRARFPSVPVECNAVEDSDFFGRSFDAIIAWGLMFLLAPDAQARLIQKVSAVLKPSGRFLFTSPYQICEWPDNLTGQKSISLGAAAYRRTVEAAGMVMEVEVDDEGANHYYFVRRLNRGAAVEQIVGRERRERVSQLAWCGEGCFDSRRRVNSDVGRLCGYFKSAMASHYSDE